MTLPKNSGNHHKDARRRPCLETRKCRGVRRNDDRQRVTDRDSRSRRIQRVHIQEFGIRRIHVLWPVQVQSTSPLVTEAEFPGSSNLPSNREVRLVRVTVDEMSPHGKRERQDGNRKSSIEIVLICKKRS